MADEKPIIVVKKKGHHGGHHGGAWKVAYADFVTAMMAFFMVMWLIGTADNPTREAVAAYFRKPGIFDTGTGRPLQMGGAGIMKEQFAPNPQSSIRVGLSAVTPAPKGKGPTNSKNKGQGTSGVDVAIPKSLQQKDKSSKLSRLGGTSEDLEKFAGQIKQQIGMTPELQKLLGEVSITVEADGIKIEIADTKETSMFSPGSAQIAPDAVPAFSKIAQFIRQTPFPLEIMGHTDGKSFSNRFNNYSNWELSADRANAARRLLERQGVDAARMQGVLGMADRELKFPDDPLAASNRRITIKLKLPPVPADPVPSEPEEELEETEDPGAMDLDESLFGNTPVLGPSPVFDSGE